MSASRVEREVLSWKTQKQFAQVRHRIAAENPAGGMLMQDQYPFINTALLYTYDALESYVDYKTTCPHH